jgi:WD40 repeat protein
MPVYGMVLCLAFSPDGATLASGATGDTVTLMDLGDGSQRTIPREYEEDNRPQDVAFSRDGTLLASADFCGFIRISEVRSGRCLKNYGWNDGATFANAVEFGPRRQLWAFASYSAKNDPGRRIAEVWEYSTDGRQIIAMRTLAALIWTFWLAFVCRNWRLGRRRSTAASAPVGNSIANPAIT